MKDTKVGTVFASSFPENQKTTTMKRRDDACRRTSLFFLVVGRNPTTDPSFYRIEILAEDVAEQPCRHLPLGVGEGGSLRRLVQSGGEVWSVPSTRVSPPNKRDRQATANPNQASHKEPEHDEPRKEQYFGVTTRTLHTSRLCQTMMILPPGTPQTACGMISSAPVRWRVVELPKQSHRWNPSGWKNRSIPQLCITVRRSIIFAPGALDPRISRSERSIDRCSQRALAGCGPTPWMDFAAMACVW